MTQLQLVAFVKQAMVSPGFKVDEPSINPKDFNSFSTFRKPEFKMDKPQSGLGRQALDFATTPLRMAWQGTLKPMVAGHNGGNSVLGNMVQAGAKATKGDFSGFSSELWKAPMRRAEPALAEGYNRTMALPNRAWGATGAPILKSYRELSDPRKKMQF